MDPLAQRILDEIQRNTLSPADRAELAAALQGVQRNGHPNPTATWSTTSEFLVELCEWAAALPPAQLPPRESDAARHFGRNIRTIGRWLTRAGIAGWDGFLRFWTLAERESSSASGH
jgi:hypothetical protein